MERRRTYSTSFIGSRKKIKACFCGVTSMTPEYVSLLLEEAPKNKAQFVPTYGNTLPRTQRSRRSKANTAASN